MPQRHSERQNPKSPYKRATSIAIPDPGPGMLHSVWRWRHASLQLTYSGGNNKVRRSKTFYRRPALLCRNGGNFVLCVGLFPYGRPPLPLLPCL